MSCTRRPLNSTSKSSSVQQVLRRGTSKHSLDQYCMLKGIGMRGPSCASQSLKGLWLVRFSGEGALFHARANMAATIDQQRASTMKSVLRKPPICDYCYFHRYHSDFNVL